MKREPSDDEVRERSHERDGSVERRHSSHSHKRKERGGSEDRSDGVDKKARVSDRRRFEDGNEANGEGRREKKERRRFEDRVKEEEEKEEDDRGFEDKKRVNVNLSEAKFKEEVSDEHYDNAWSLGTANASRSVSNVSFLLIFILFTMFVLMQHI